MDKKDSLQFDRFEPAAGAAAAAGTMACTVCGNLLNSSYFVVNGHIVCDQCRQNVESEWNRGGAPGRFGKALGLGILAMIACSVIWYLVLKWTNSQWGILAIVVGLVIGSAVRKGSNGRGGWRYQTLAIFLTYTAIVSSYVPFIVEEFRQQRAAEMSKQGVLEEGQKPATSLDTTASTASSASAADIGPIGFAIGLVVLLALLYAAPIVASFNIIGLLIIGIALYEAWKLNLRTELRVSGPHQVSTAGAPA